MEDSVNISLEKYHKLIEKEEKYDELAKEREKVQKILRCLIETSEDEIKEKAGIPEFVPIYPIFGECLIIDVEKLKSLDVFNRDIKNIYTDKQLTKVLSEHSSFFKL